MQIPYFIRKIETTPKRRIVAAGIILALIVVAIGFIVSLKNETTESVPQTSQGQVQSVQATALADLQQEAILTRSAILEPREQSPIVARSGGRVTSLTAAVGDPTIAGAVIGKLDGGSEPNPLAAQARSASTVASLFSLIEQQALISADNAVALAEQGFQAAQAGQQIGVDIQRTSVNITSTSLDQALLSARNAEDTEIDAAIDAANIGVKAATLARDLAIGQSQLQNQSATDAAAIASLNVRAATIGRERTRAELANQRAQLSGQLATLKEQLRLQDITTATSGAIASLTVTIGDFVSPNQQIGSVIAAGSGRLALEVPQIIAQSLILGQEFPVQVNNVSLTARVDSISQTSGSSGLFTTELVIDNNVPADAYGKQAQISFTVGGSNSTYLLPLDAIVVRSHGPSIFILEAGNIAGLRTVVVHGYHGQYAEVSAALSPNDKIIVTNTRLLQDGTPVTANE